MNKLSDALNSLQQEIMNDEIVKEYFRVRDLIIHDEQIKQLKNKVNNAQVALSLSMGDEEEHAKKKSEYERVLSKYEAHPMVANFTNLQIELYDFLKNIADLLE